MKLKSFIKNNTSFIVFVLILISISAYYNNDKYLFFRPQSIHAWRQADCASITLNYYQNGMNFFKPQVHNLTSDNGQTGYCSTSEIPVLYYFSAISYNFFGANEIIIRIINSLIFFLGLLYLFKIVLFLFKDNFWAIAFSIVFYTSTVLIYYGNNYLTNVSALSFAIIGLYYFFKYNHKQNKKFLLLSLLFFLLSGIFKVTALMTFFAILSYYILEKTKLFGKKKKLFNKHNNIFIISATIIFLIIGGWIFYTSYFNKCHDCSYFSTTIFPIWDMNSIEIKNLIDHVREFWLTDYFHKSLHILFIIMFVFILIRLKKINFIYAILLLVLIVQSIVYISLQFWTFYNHDYYTINQYIVPIFIGIVFLDIAFKNHEKIMKNIYLKIIFSLFILFNIYHAKNKLSERYTTWKNNYKTNNEEIYSISPYLREIGISFSDKVIYFPDKSNVSLYLMNQWGWTQYTDAKFNRGEPIKYNQDSVGISKSINLGAKYLIINNPDILYEYPYLQSFATNLIGSYKNVLIFNLVDTVSNFKIPQKEITDTIICNAEQISDGMYLTSNNSYLLENGNTQSDKKAYEGMFSSLLTKNNPYGMTIKIYDCKFGEGFHVTVWRYGNQAVIVASGPAETKFYLTDSKIIEKDTINNWEKIELDFSVPENMIDKEMKIFLYNPNSDTVFFDNLTIERYNKPKLIQ